MNPIKITKTDTIKIQIGNENNFCVLIKNKINAVLNIKIETIIISEIMVIYFYSKALLIMVTDLSINSITISHCAFSSCFFIISETISDAPTQPS